ncbi:MAG: hypothetical protein JST60_22535 [Chloroflexi bacterium SZAS-1]|nr:hypothetical protein [Chloroflexi bacterium SZAS-1]HNP86708.1 hypothetical protein [Kouleothrix sp.]
MERRRQLFPARRTALTHGPSRSSNFLTAAQVNGQPFLRWRNTAKVGLDLWVSAC